MNLERLAQLLQSFAQLRIAVVGDFCLDRYLEIDAAHREVSIETGLPVYKVDRVRAQPGAAGTVLNNLVALGVGSVLPVGFAGEDGEGYELERALASTPGVSTRGFVRTPERRTFTYCKPLLMERGRLPEELSRLDSKNWTPTSQDLSAKMAALVRELTSHIDAVAVMDQVDISGTGVITSEVLQALAALAEVVPVLADSRSGLGRFPPLIFKLNRNELHALGCISSQAGNDELCAAVEALADRNRRPSFATLAEDGIVGATPGVRSQWVPSLPVRGPIDIVGAGDSVTAALTAALAAEATLGEAMELAMLAASVTVHQIGTTGLANASAILELAQRH